MMFDLTYYNKQLNDLLSTLNEEKNFVDKTNSDSVAIFLVKCEKALATIEETIANCKDSEIRDLCFKAKVQAKLIWVEFIEVLLDFFAKWYKDGLRIAPENADIINKFYKEYCFVKQKDEEIEADRLERELKLEQEMEMIRQNKIANARENHKILLEELNEGIDLKIDGIDIIITTDINFHSNSSYELIVPLTYRLANNWESKFTFEILLQKESYENQWIDEKFISQLFCKWALYKIDNLNDFSAYPKKLWGFFSKMNAALKNMNERIVEYRKVMAEMIQEEEQYEEELDYEEQVKMREAYEQEWDLVLWRLQEGRINQDYEEYSSFDEYMDDWTEYNDMD